MFRYRILTAEILQGDVSWAHVNAQKAAARNGNNDEDLEHEKEGTTRTILPPSGL
ncbi:MAG: hypothetical protein MZW92_31220 [Comamonadaceae bacterium]|nr:hypothetical protein [Comamonadaceae bacterium]